jgi:hypothetical protein
MIEQMIIKGIPKSFLDYVRFYLEIDEGLFQTERDHIKYVKNLWHNETKERKKNWLKYNYKEEE